MPKAPRDVRHITTETPRVLVVDGSKVVRKLIGDLLKADLPGVDVTGCAGQTEAEAALASGPFDLVTTSLSLPDGERGATALVAGASLAIAGSDAAKLLKLLDALEELDDVQKVHSNADIDEAALAEAM